MTKHIILFLTFLGVSGLAFAQNLQLIDSLKFELGAAEAQRRFDLLNDLAWEYRWAYPDSTIHYAKQASALGAVLNLSKSLAEPINFMGVAQNYKGNRLMAFEHYDQALTISMDQRDSLQIAHSNNNLGRLFFEQGLLRDLIPILLRHFLFLKPLRIPPAWHILTKVLQTCTRLKETTLRRSTITSGQIKYGWICGTRATSCRLICKQHDCTKRQSRVTRPLCI